MKKGLILAVVGFFILSGAANTAALFGYPTLNNYLMKQADEFAQAVREAKAQNEAAE